MNKAIITFFVLIFACDFWLRVYPSGVENKQVELQKNNVEKVQLQAPAKPQFNKDLFGKVSVEEKIQQKDKVTKKKEEPQLILLAVFSTPKTYAFVSLKNSNQPAKKMQIGETYQGFKLNKISGTSALFTRANKQIELKVFKG